MDKGPLRVVTSGEVRRKQKTITDPKHELVKAWAINVRDEVLANALSDDQSFNEVWEEALKTSPKPRFLTADYAETIKFNEVEFRHQLDYLWREIRKRK
ncbi:MAG: hypothetical protein JJ934_18840 [Pseudomonadales bacterium]|nr:hypothetical protein [Pseudomonadales bacterium]MBO6567017.1 hypothetical protein [Pseudomonadales bacterium]MBO6597815.1 hypothetical protein [Pseudomonadales bacterium]MBO6658957.1 hypothetical protein [Pseudomonadales bacterium]MBO6702363.1 hypothetical protein [Pseudomonadales bacterium]